MQEIGRYDVIVAGAGVTGIVAAVAAARQGARVCLVEAGNTVGGLLTGGFLTKPTGVIQPGVYNDLVMNAAKYGGADPTVRITRWGAYSGIWDPEVMQRVVIELLEEEKVDVLLYAPVTGVIRDGNAVTGLQVQTKAGAAVLKAKTVVDSTGDGDVAALAGAEYMLGRAEDGLLQPMTSYFRIVDVDIDALIAYCIDNRDDMKELTVPESGADAADSGPGDFFMVGLRNRIQEARESGFNWILPKFHMSMKKGMLRGEVNVNATRVHGNALDPFVRSRATIEMRKQAYCVFDFLKGWVPGFADAKLLEVSPVLGVRETRRIHGDYVLSADDVHNETRFVDAIGLSTDPVDIHDPSGPGTNMYGVHDGYGIPYRCLLPRGVENILTGGRCISADDVSYGSIRNTPSCALTGQAAGTAAALAALAGLTPRELPVQRVQSALREVGVVLGVSPEEFVPHRANRHTSRHADFASTTER